MFDPQDRVVSFVTILLVVGVLVSFSVGTGANGPAADDLENAIADVESYEYETEVATASTAIENGKEREPYSEGEGDGAVNITAGELRETIITETTGDEVTVDGEIETQTYLVDDTYHTSTTAFGEDTERIKIDAPETGGITGGPLAEYKYLLSAFDVDALGKVELDGTDTSVLEFTVDTDTYWKEMVTDLENGELDAATGNVDANSAATNDAASEDSSEPTQEITVTMWIDVETDLPVKSELVMETSIDEFGSYETDSANGDVTGNIDRIETTVTQTTFFQAYDEPVDIVLPEGAEDAQTIEERLEQLETDIDEEEEYDFDEGALVKYNAEELDEDITDDAPEPDENGTEDDC